MRALEFITGHVIYNPSYTYKFQLPLFLPKDVCSNQINVNPNARPL